MVDQPAAVRTPARAVTAPPLRVKGSRFLAHLAPAADMDAARAVVAQVRGGDPDATHHCWACRLADGAHRVDDDGEPGGTAGAPILRHLDGAGLADVVAVVSRWFGGTKLGTGGLVRAYGDATAAAIAAAEIVARPVTATFELLHDYELSAAVAGVVAAHDATVVEADYGARVRLRVAVAVGAGGAFAADVTEATAGRVVPRRQD